MKLKTIARAAITTLAIIAMIVSGIYIEIRLDEYRREAEIKKDMVQMTAGRTESEERDTIPEIDLRSLRDINPDVKAWIMLPGTEIDYPVVQGKDNEQYLYHNIYGEYQASGSIFIDSVNTRPFQEFNTVVYGHHMLSGSMFTALKDFKDEEFFREHDHLYLFTEEGTKILNVAAFFIADQGSDLYNVFYSDEAARDAHIDFINNSAMYRSDIVLGNRDRLVTLSTCAYEFENARYILVCSISEPDDPAGGVCLDTHEANSGSGTISGKVNRWLVMQILLGCLMFMIVVKQVKHIQDHMNGSMR